MKNGLVDLNNHLFAQIERLSDEDLKGDDLKEELGRAKAITGVSSQIVNNAKVLLDAAKFKADYNGQKPAEEMPALLLSK